MTDLKSGKIGNKNAAKDEKLETGFSGRCRTADKNRWVKAAQAKGMNLNQWIVENNNKAVEEEDF